MKYIPKYRIYNKLGRLAWQYNPFRNYRLNNARIRIIELVDGYEHNHYYSLSNSGTDIERLNKVRSKIYEDLPGISISGSVLSELTATPVDKYRLVFEDKYLLVDFDTDELGFKITNPVSIIAQPSYDGSVNLILNDGINIPRLINSRWSSTGNDTYEIVDRNGNDDTNIYDEGIQFDIDTALYKKINQILEIEFEGCYTGGLLSVGNYHFYFKLMDADGNESDFIGQSNLVSVFIGTSIKSMHTGMKNLDSHKLVKFIISKIDVAYPYVSVYYSRSSAEGTEQSTTEYKQILKKYIVSNSGNAHIIITGFENTEDVSERDINMTYNIVDKVKTHTLNQNRLFLGNVKKADIPYNILRVASLNFVPTPVVEPYELNLTQNYASNNGKLGYYDVKNIYNKVGYWPNEYYRFGIVYIMKSGELSPVFNIRGALNIAPNSAYTQYPVIDSNGDFIENVKYDESTYLLQECENISLVSPQNYSPAIAPQYENVKGVIKLHKALDNNDNFSVIGIRITLLDEEVVLKELSKYCRGYFFVRQRRIPTILCLGLSIGVEKTSHLPMIPVTNDSIIKHAISNASKNHLVYSYPNPNKSYEPEEYTIRNMNYITEGFLSRYVFTFKKKKSSWWKKIGSAMLIGIGVAIIVVASIVTFGGAAAVAGIAAAAAVAATTIITAAYYAAIAAVIIIVIAATDELVLAVKRATADKTFNGWETQAPSGYNIVEDSNKSRRVGGEFKDRLIIKNPNLVLNIGLLCPDYAMDLPYYNSIFTGDTHVLIPDQILPAYRYFSNDYTRHFYINAYQKVNKEDLTSNTTYSAYESSSARLIGVPEGTSVAGIESTLFRSKAGEAEEAFRFLYVGNEYKKASPTSDTAVEDIDSELRNQKINSDIARGIFCSYLGSSTDLGTTYLYNIMVAGYADNNLLTYLNFRAEDTSEFYCISKRYDITDLNFYDDDNDGDPDYINPFEYENKNVDVYSGDCYICLVTQRLIRNFNSPSLPYNDEIIKPSTWYDNYDPDNSEKLALINLGDVNAVQLGIWVTFKLRSSKNLNIRTIDESNVDEVSGSGHYRSFYPLTPMSTGGGYKIPESQVYNKGFEKSVSSQYHYVLSDVPYIKNWFGTRVMYSDIHVNDAFKNGYRVFRPGCYRDYTREYGSITKLLSVGSYIIVVMEHGILRLTVNTNNVTTDSSINYKNVLPENPDVISKDYGSEWADSIILTPNGIYGIDTHAKKLWVTDGQTIDLISENSVLRFLNENIILKEREKTPILGRRNVKTLYNQFKGDVMFTFYNIKDYDEVAWNLCYNEKMKRFVTFYSWIPSFMENINNIPFSFDRETSRMFSLLYNENDIVKLENPVFTEDSFISNFKIDYYDGYEYTIEPNKDVRLGKFFNIKESGDSEYPYTLEFINDLTGFPEGKILNVPLTLTVSVNYDKLHPTSIQDAENESVSTTYNIIVLIVSQEYYNETSVDFWVHGQAGIMDDKEKIKPTNWYGKQHPFEFEFVVADNLQYLKIFDNIQLIANKALPESFHYEVVGDCYDFSKDKINMYYRQEALKYLYNFNGSDIAYDDEYSLLKERLSLNKKSADFPKTYYARLDKINQIYNEYKSKKGYSLKDSYIIEDDNLVYQSYKKNMPSSSYNYDHLSGAEIVWYKLEDEFRVWQHSKAVNVDTLSQEDARSLIAANCRYLEDKWVITINPLVICYKNEKLWEKYDEDNNLIGEPPVTIYNQPFPEDMVSSYIPDEIQAIDDYSWLDDVSINGGYSFGTALNRKESDIRGRYVKIRIRYSGEELAIIDFINTIYRISYA